MLKFLISSLLSLTLGFAGASAHAEDYPTKPVKIVVPFTAGGGVDGLGRVLAEKLAAKLGQPVIVDNRPGASGNIAAEYVYRSAPDGYTLFLAGDGTLAVNKALFARLGFEPEKFEPVSMLSVAPLMIVVNPKLPVRTLPELIAYAKANPGRISFGSAGAGGASHLAAEVFQKSTGTRFVHVPYKGIAPAFNDLLAGHVDMMFGFEASVGPYMHGDKVRVLAVTGEKRHPALPNVPAASEVVPGYVMVSWTVLVAPPGTPANVVQKLSAACADIMRMPEVVSRMREQGYETVGTSTAAARTFVKAEAERWHKAVQSAGITPE
jgi:tripartite-type tricarboxylate transporter receptor subunit TctC